MTNVGSSASFPVVDDDGLAINYYSDEDYGLYSVEIILIWVLIGIIWSGSLIFLFLDHYSLLMVI